MPDFQITFADGGTDTMKGISLKEIHRIASEASKTGRKVVGFRELKDDKMDTLETLENDFSEPQNTSEWFVVSGEKGFLKSFHGDPVWVKDASMAAASSSKEEAQWQAAQHGAQVAPLHFNPHTRKVDGIGIAERVTTQPKPSPLDPESALETAIALVLYEQGDTDLRDVPNNVFYAVLEHIEGNLNMVNGQWQLKLTNDRVCGVNAKDSAALSYLIHQIRERRAQLKDDSTADSSKAEVPPFKPSRSFPQRLKRSVGKHFNPSKSMNTASPIQQSKGVMSVIALLIFAIVGIVLIFFSFPPYLDLATKMLSGRFGIGQQASSFTEMFTLGLQGAALNGLVFAAIAALAVFAWKVMRFPLIVVGMVAGCVSVVLLSRGVIGVCATLPFILVNGVMMKWIWGRVFPIRGKLEKAIVESEGSINRVESAVGRSSLTFQDFNKRSMETITRMPHREAHTLGWMAIVGAIADIIVNIIYKLPSGGWGGLITLRIFTPEFVVWIALSAFLAEALFWFGCVAFKSAQGAK